MEAKQKIPFDQLPRHQKIHRIFSIIVFLTVFIFSFCLISDEMRQGLPLIILLSTWGGTVLVEIILWITLYFIFKNKDKTQNDKNVEKVLKEMKKEQKEK